jgi:hypothetical protein
MGIVAIVIVLALVQFVALGMLVGRARGQYGVKAPSITGHEVFERYFRVQQNTLELLVVFVPAIWLFASYVSPRWAAILGAIAVPFYSEAGAWAWPLAALSVYVLLTFALFQLALWPLAVFEDAPFRAVVRDAAFVVARRPWGFAGLALALLLVNAIGVAAAILPFLTLTIAYSFLVSAHFALPKNPALEV